MGFYGNILTTDLGVQSQIQDIYNRIEDLKDVINNQDFDIDGNEPGNTSNSIDLILAINDLERRLSIVEQCMEEVQDIIGQLYTEIVLVHKLLISDEEASNWPDMPELPRQEGEL